MNNAGDNKIYPIHINSISDALAPLKPYALNVPSDKHGLKIRNDVFDKALVDHSVATSKVSSQILSALKSAGGEYSKKKSLCKTGKNPSMSIKRFIEKETAGVSLSDDNYIMMAVAKHFKKKHGSSFNSAGKLNKTTYKMRQHGRSRKKTGSRKKKSIR